MCLLSIGCIWYISAFNSDVLIAVLQFDRPLLNVFVVLYSFLMHGLDALIAYRLYYVLCTPLPRCLYLHTIFVEITRQFGPIQTNTPDTYCTRLNETVI